MARITDSDLQSKLRELSSLVGIKTSAKRLGPKAKNFYSNKFLSIEGSYGKKQIDIINQNTSRSHVTPLLSKPELYEYMEAMIKGIRLKARKK